jgi:hypothetical protein
MAQAKTALDQSSQPNRPLPSTALLSLAPDQARPAADPHRPAATLPTEHVEPEPPKPSPPPRCCWNCGCPHRACAALTDSAHPLRRCCVACVHPPKRPIPRDVAAALPANARRGRAAAAWWEQHSEAALPLPRAATIQPPPLLRGRRR